MNEVVLLGAEAIAQGAIDGGMSGVYAYPGTPSTEITEYIQRNSGARKEGIHSEWSANEKTAMESAIGMSYAGKRAMVCMKHVGLNVAADPFINSAITGAGGGLIVVVADDPSMHSSQNEQDSRFYGDFALLPILEPADQQEAYDMAYNGFSLSEKVGLPVLMRITTRLSHSRSRVLRMKNIAENELKLPDDKKKFILLPSIARERYKLLLNLQDDLTELSENAAYNTLKDGNDRSLGIIACGISHNYLMENYPEGIPHPVLKIGQYPVPVKKIKEITSSCKEILVLEEGYPILEKSLLGLLNNSPVPIRGRLDGSLPRDGELNSDLVRKALGMEVHNGPEIPEIMVNRPPALCKGCGHIDIYHSLIEALTDFGEGRTFADIGCYTLGALPPYNAINTCVDMGASITMAKGAADAGLVPSVAVIGDSTFTHSGMTGLLDAVIENSPITIIISDNETTGMTGGQVSSAVGRIEGICLGIGVEESHLKIVTPLKKNHDENVQVILNELNYHGISVIIARRECIQTASKRKRIEVETKSLSTKS
ncbi:MAG: indolepyruvate ferredoxin oxidoreductase [Bacteroidetes bacterium]|jgi:indolepyruvate ferredoxin oxidoreductase, alpha subunit|nr:indolepyruvate ferredoxin oxidoreductase [Bacteroidota bacterium]MBT4400329.1 indolepyruvate ferredoxin oxidoreductase [Bacteroidota bacterium]MBT4408609.1 indolepyruvate ferredoxin oxidoreductase [Bacteroidota bacterium]MBT5424646.1 indolepyruvate ferredoxin oxidoreductase [Bacteroidota bacterium]MBT7092095.1 indolepyruvate ferredoxin oxidoreductase [Bacteroidota bacterium]